MEDEKKSKIDRYRNDNRRYEIESSLQSMQLIEEKFYESSLKH